MRRARREPSTGMMRVTASSIAPPSRRQKNSRKTIMKKPTTVPMAPRATSPPTASADRTSVCTPPALQVPDGRAITQGVQNPVEQIPEERRSRDLEAAPVELGRHEWQAYREGRPNARVVYRRACEDLPRSA